MVGGLVLGMAGCSVASETTDGGGGAAASPSVESETAVETPAFHFKSGDLPLGEFDPDTLGDNLFNPCAEISEEEFASIGFTKRDDDFGYEPETKFAGCYFDIGQIDRSLGFVAVEANFDVIMANPKVISTSTVPSVPGSYVFLQSGRKNDCHALVDTVRGAVGVTVTSSHPDDREEDLCPIATDALESLYAIGPK